MLVKPEEYRSFFVQQLLFGNRGITDRTIGSFLDVPLDTQSAEKVRTLQTMVVVVVVGMITNDSTIGKLDIGGMKHTGVMTGLVI